MDSKFKIRVTNFYSSQRRTKKWQVFLEAKGIETFYKEKVVNGKKQYALMRVLTPKEEEEIQLGQYILCDESLLLPLSEIRKRRRMQ